MVGQWLVAILFTLRIPVSLADYSSNVALHSKVIGNGNWHEYAVDGKFDTTFYPFPDSFPYFYVDLEAVYNLSSINLFCQDEWAFKHQGINVRFDVHTFGELMSPCSFEALYPWKTLALRLMFTKKGQEIILKPTKPVRYIIIGRPNWRYPEPMASVPFGEVQAHGIKVQELPEPQIPVDDGPVPENYYKETRRAIIGTQQRIWMDPAYGHFEPNAKYKDVALGWLNGPNSMAIVREQAKMIILMGIALMSEIDSHPIYPAIRSSFKMWLTNGLSTASYVRISSTYKPGDVLLITREDQFDVDEVYQKLISGENSAFVGYTVKDQDDNLSELLKKLEVEFVKTDVWVKPRFIYVHSSADSDDYIPTSYQLERYVNSWEAFSTEQFSTAVRRLDSESEYFQDMLKAVVDKYKTLMEHLGPCDTKPYHRTEETATALMNYNSMLKYQYGATGFVLPHVDRFPGTISSTAKSTTITATVYADRPGTFFPITAYAKPGEGFRWTILGNSDPNYSDQFLRINAHTDETSHHSEWNRWPSISTVIPLKNQGQLNSPHGGPIFLELPQGGNVTIQLEDVYRYAWIDVRDHSTIRSFNQQLRDYSKVPWVVISGDSMTSMLRTIDVHNTNPSEIISSTKHFDKAIKVMHKFRGSSWESARSEMFVPDVQLPFGDGHSGYPWMGSIDWSRLFTLWSDSIKYGGQPGFVQELGHNLQVREATLKNGDDVTNNVYQLVINTVLLKVDPYAGDKDTEKWSSSVYSGPGLGYYKYLSDLFDLGLVGNVFTEARKVQPQTEEEKTQFWLQEICNETGYDLLPFHQMWNFPVTQETQEMCSRLPCFFPDDNWTKSYQNKVDQVLQQYEKKCMRSGAKKVKFQENIRSGINKIRPKNIFIKSK